MNRYLSKVAEVVGLEKVALRRAVAEFAKGNISTSLKDLVRAGVIKDGRTYAKGMKLGNSNIAKQVGANIVRARPGVQQALSHQGSGYTTFLTPGKGSVILTNAKEAPFNPNKVEHQGFIRHELFETMDGNIKQKKLSNHLKNLPPIFESLRASGADYRTSKGLDRFMSNVSKTKVGYSKVVGLRGNSSEITVGGHFTPRVLVRESEMVRKNPHLQGKLQAIRKHTLENNLVQRLTGKKYGSDRMTSSDLKKAFHAKPDGYDDFHGNKVPKFVEYANVIDAKTNK